VIVRDKKKKRKFLKSLKGGTVLVWRFTQNATKTIQKLDMSAPCRDCFKYIKKYVNLVKYCIYSNSNSNDEGSFTKKRLINMKEEECYVSFGYISIRKKQCKRLCKRQCKRKCKRYKQKCKNKIRRFT